MKTLPHSPWAIISNYQAALLLTRAGHPSTNPKGTTSPGTNTQHAKHLLTTSKQATKPDPDVTLWTLFVLFAVFGRWVSAGMTAEDSVRRQADNDWWKETPPLFGNFFSSAELFVGLSSTDTNSCCYKDFLFCCLFSLSNPPVSPHLHEDYSQLFLLSLSGPWAC